MLKKSKNYLLENKVKSLIVLLLILGASYYGYKKYTNTDAQNRYVFGTVKKGMLIMSISGTGQVTPVNQIDLKPKASGDIIWLNAIAGTEVSAGTIIAKLNTKDVSASVRDANVSLEGARLSYDQYKTQNSDEKLSSNLIKSYDAGYSAVNAALLDIPTLQNNLEDLNTKDAISQNTARLIGGNSAIDLYNKSESKFYIAQAATKSLVSSYKGLERKSPNSVIAKALTDTYKTTKLLSDAIKSKKDFIDFLYDQSNKSTTYVAFQTSLGQYSTTINADMNSVLTSITNIQDSESAFSNTALGIQSSALSIKQKQNSLIDAQDKLEDYIVRAPFAGLIAKSDSKLGDSASPSTVIATLITKKKIAEISLNEVDVAKVKIGQKTTLTFDAIPDLSISGEVTEIDLVGTETQGVVTYKVKIAFDTQEDRVKPGMSVSASIITQTKQDVLIVPNSAVKNQSGSKYVETSLEAVASETSTTTSKGVLLINSPDKTTVTIGLANDTYTEILSGLNEGDRIITRTITPSTAAAKTTNSSVRLPGIGGGGRGN